MNCVEGVMEIVVIDSGEMFQGPTAPKGTTGQPRAERSAALGHISPEQMITQSHRDTEMQESEIGR
ncbi:MAG: hypothetical protein U0939_03250 [Pirellulales bacterium]